MSSLSVTAQPVHKHSRPNLKEVRQVFPKAIAAGFMLPELEQGLHVEFGKCVNLFDELGLSPASSVLFSPKLCDLTRKFGFINLKNCYVPAIGRVTDLSHGEDDHGYLVQDPFHRDRLRNSVEFLTVIHRQRDADKHYDAGRPEPTYYALEEDVKAAIEDLAVDGLPDPVIHALSDMTHPDYKFNLYNENEMPARLAIQYGYPQFVTDVYDKIPAGRKFAKNWLAGVWDVVIHANQSGPFLHARATGRKISSPERAFNPLGGLEIFRG